MLKHLKLTTLLALIFVAHTTFAQRLFWTETNKIKFAPFSSAAIGTPITQASITNIRYLTLDPAFQSSFYTDNFGSLYKKTYNGSAAGTEIYYYAAMSGVVDIDYSNNADAIFACKEDGDNGISYVLEGSPSTETYLDLDDQSNETMKSLVVDDGSERIFFYNEDRDGIYMVGFNGGTPQLVCGGLGVIVAIAYDEFLDRIVFLADNNEVYFCDIGDTPQFVTTLTGSVSPTIEVYGKMNLIFFASDDKIFNMNFSGSPKNQLYSGGVGISEISIEPDLTLPTVTNYLPAPNATGELLEPTVRLTFDDEIRIQSDAGSGTAIQIRVFKTTGDQLLQTYDRSNANLVISGKTVDIMGLDILEQGTSYYFLIGNRVFEDLSGNNYNGISAKTTWTFTTLGSSSTKLYSRTSGEWTDPDTWSEVSHTGPASTITPGTGVDAEIGAGHTVTLTSDVGIVANSTGLVIQTGGQLDMQSAYTLTVWGDIRIDGFLKNGGTLAGEFDLYSAELPVFTGITVTSTMTGDPGEATLHTNVVAYDGVNSDDGTLNLNGFQVCTPPGIPTTGPTPITNSKSTGATLNWNPGSGSAFIILRESSTSATQPKFEMSYTSNAQFGSGTDVGGSNYAIYTGTGNLVNITGLTAETDYWYDMYGYSTAIGGCYSLNNYQSGTFTTCPVIVSPSNPVSGTYCSGTTKTFIQVDDPGAGNTIRWYDALTGGNLVTGNTSGGTGRGEIFIPTAASGTFYSEIYNTSSQCSSGTRTAATLTMLPALVSGTASATQNVCNDGDPTVLTGGTATGGDGNYTYQWASSTTPGGSPYNSISGATSATYDPPASPTATLYYVRSVTSPAVLLCQTISSEIKVGVIAKPIITASPAAKGVCGSEPSSFRVLATGTNLTYQWQANSGSGFTNVSNTGVYTGATTSQLNISNSSGMNGYIFQCIVTESATCSVTSDATGILNVNEPPTALDVPASFCETAPGSGTTTVNLLDFNDEVTNNDANLAVVWYDDANFTKMTSTPDNITATNGKFYYARVFDGTCANGGTLTVTVTSKPSVSATSPVTICSGETTGITFNATPTGVTYSWTVSSTSKITGAADGSGTSIVQTINNVGATQEKITYMVMPLLSGGCEGTSFEQIVFVDPVPTKFNVTGSGTFCPGGNIDVKLSGSQAGISYMLVKDNINTQTIIAGTGGALTMIKATVPGTYTVTAVTTADCKVAMNGSAVVQQNSAPTGTGVIAGDASFCADAEKTFFVSGITGAATYTWSLPDGIVAVTPSTSTSITVKATGAVSGSITVMPSNTCGEGVISSPKAVTTLAKPEVEIKISPEGDIRAEEPATFSYTASTTLSSILWDLGNGESSTDESPVTTYDTDGTYTVSIDVTDNNNCSNLVSRNIVIVPKAALGDMAISNIITANGDDYNGLLYIANLEKFPDNEVIVVDRWGAEVFRRKNYTNDWDFKKGEEFLPAGNYVCVLKSGGKTYSRTITVLKQK